LSAWQLIVSVKCVSPLPPFFARVPDDFPRPDRSLALLLFICACNITREAMCVTVQSKCRRIRRSLLLLEDVLAEPQPSTLRSHPSPRLCSGVLPLQFHCWPFAHIEVAAVKARVSAMVSWADLPCACRAEAPWRCSNAYSHRGAIRFPGLSLSVGTSACRIPPRPQ